MLYVQRILYVGYLAHFGHANIIKFVNRPFKTYQEMDQVLIENWNSVVSKGDTVYHLGDVVYGRDATQTYTERILNQLNGEIHLILGNHDKTAKSLSHKFSSIKLYDEIEVLGQRIILFHYGLRTWHHDLRGVWHLYGHSHNGLPPYGKSCDVGVDCWNFKPISFAELKVYMDQRPIEKHPRFPGYEPNDILKKM
jgi:calcineurin-like phosphoesterase family protein